jgi:epoxyqueuosine reductase
MLNSISERIRERAREEGFDVVRFTPAQAAPEASDHLAAFLAQGRHGTMDWLARNADRRADPAVLWPETKSAIVLGANYAQDGDALEGLAHPERGNISVYARGDDYHDVLKAKLKRLAQFVTSETGADVKVFIDTAPVMEKPLAQAAGLGWQGKHTNLVSRDFGSWLFIGSIFTTLDLPPDEPQADLCGQCTRCLEACPTNAFTAPYRIDARRCISYLTIEHKGPIPHEFREAMGNRIYGCDDCLAVCPWNKFAQAGREARFHARETLANARLADLVRLDDVAFRELFRGSPVKRTGRDRFVRNVLIAMGNAKDPSLAPEAERLLGDPSPLVRGAAVWALSRLDPHRSATIAAAQMQSESDPDVLLEWRSIDAPLDAA